MTHRFDPRNLQVGDVLLYHSNALISRTICLLDGAKVSHAAIYLGPDRIGEALMDQGLVARKQQASFDQHDWVEVRRIKAPNLDLSPVCLVAERYLAQHNRYAYEQILLLGGICLTRKLDFDNPLIRLIAQKAMAAADAVVQQMSDEGKQPMICSEFVFRDYDEARPELDDPYTLTILSQQSAAPRRRFSWLREVQGIAGPTGLGGAPGMHPESLLAGLEKRLATLEVIPPPSAARRMAESFGDLDQLLQQFLAGDQSRTPAAPPNSHETGRRQLEPTALRFARTLAAVMPKSETDGRATTGSLAAASPGERMRAAVADFVTPGDLDVSPSLVTMGTILV